MKKSSLLVLVLAIFLWSCSDDDNGANDQNSVGQGSGTVTVDGETWEFNIHACTIRADGSFSFTAGPVPGQEPSHLEVFLQNYLPTANESGIAQLTIAAGPAPGDNQYLYGTDPDEDQETVRSHFHRDGNRITSTNLPVLRLRHPGHPNITELVEVESSLEASCTTPSSGLI